MNGTERPWIFYEQPIISGKSSHKYMKNMYKDFTDGLLVIAKDNPEVMAYLKLVFKRLRENSYPESTQEGEVGAYMVQFLTISWRNQRWPILKSLSTRTTIVHKLGELLPQLYLWPLDSSNTHIEHSGIGWHEAVKGDPMRLRSRGQFWEVQRTYQLVPKAILNNEKYPIVMCTYASDYAMSANLIQVDEEQK